MSILAFIAVYLLVGVAVAALLWRLDGPQSGSNVEVGTLGMVVVLLWPGIPVLAAFVGGLHLFGAALNRIGRRDAAASREQDS